MIWVERATEAVVQGRPHEAWDLAANAARDSAQPRVRHAARVLMHQLAAQLPSDAWTRDRLMTARIAGVEPHHTPTLGAAAFPVVGGTGRFVVVRVDRQAPGSIGDHLPPSLDAEQQAAVHDALAAARALCGQDEPLAVWFDTLGWTSTSCGLAVAIAAISCLRGITHERMPLATGGIDADGRVLAVHGLSPKLTLLREHRPLGQMFVPGDCPLHDAGLAPVHRLSDVVACAPEQEDAYELVRGHVAARDQCRWDDAVRLARRALHHPDVRPAERWEARTTLLHAANHTADHARAAELAADLSLHDLDGATLAQAAGAAAVAAVDRFDPEEASRILNMVDRTRVDDADLVHLDGPAALVAILDGRFNDAVVLRRANVRRATSDEMPRCLGDLADALRRDHQLDEGLAVIRHARQQRGRVRRRAAYLHRTDVFLALHEARLLFAMGRSSEARDTLDAAPSVPGPDPALRINLLRAELDGSLGAALKAWDRVPYLHGSPLARALYARSLAALGGPVADPPFGAPPLVGCSTWEASLRLPY